MLKLKILKNIGIVLAVILVVQILFLFPKKEDYITAINTNETDIYLFDNNNYVSRVNIQVKSTNTYDLINEKISLMTKNDLLSYKLRSGFLAPIPENTRLLDYHIKNGILVLNFSKELLNIENYLEEKMIEAIVYSLTSIKGINGITIKVNNNILNKIEYNNKVLPEVLDRSFKINKEFNSNSINNLKEVTIYYPATIDDFLYYIPITKITDDKNEKIEIIINELKSSTTYNTNFVEFINEETELINYEFIDRSLVLNFTDSIFTDINSKTIKEEITYAINSSIKDTYTNIDNVLYFVDDDIFNNYFLLLG
ncbi:MAG: GerMN domain-containing protein [Bacilli bacterium]|nr:GerMN domain-containing protein [Bacilli bacterium]